MRRILLLLVALLCNTAPLSWSALEETPPSTDPSQPHRSSEAVKKAISAVIESQLAAFRAEDYAKAYTFAAEEIRGMFSLAQFEAMVKGGYPIIAHSSSAEFGIAIDTGDEAVVTVKVQNADGKAVSYQYHMTRQKGVWRIGGVSEVESKGLTV